MPSGFPFRAVNPVGFDLSILLREGFQATGTGSGATSNASGAVALDTNLGIITPIAGHCLWIESISFHSGVDVFIHLQRVDSNLIANNASAAFNPVGVGPTYGYPVIPINSFLKEGESLLVVLKTAVPSGSGTNTFNFRFGFNGRRVTNDLAFEAPKSMMVIGDSITNTAISNQSTGGTSFGSDFYHAQLARMMRAARKQYRRIVKGDGGWKTSHALYAMRRGWFDIPPPDLITIMLGTNETLLSDFQTNLPILYQYCRDMYPDALIGIIGPPPRQDSVEVSLMIPLRTWTASYVNGLSDAKARFASVAASFDRTVDANYLASDGVSGTRIHPIASAHTAMANTIKTDWQSSGFWDLL